jgi:uncharacterized protein (TIGR01655 family)
MKKIVGIIVAVLVVVIGIAGFRYYNSTYRAQEAYAVVPKTVPTKTQTKDDDGKTVAGDASYHYQLNFVKRNGQRQTMGFSVSGSDPTPLQPGSYIKAKISQKRVVSGPNTVSQADVPAQVLQKLK